MHIHKYIREYICENREKYSLFKNNLFYYVFTMKCYLYVKDDKITCSTKAWHLLAFSGTTGQYWYQPSYIVRLQIRAL